MSEKISTKAWSLTVLGIVLGAMLLSAIFTYIWDPFLHYHEPWFGFRSIGIQESYVNPGLALRGDYDSLLVGTSMVQNLAPSRFNDLFGGKFIKLTFAGGSTYNFKLVLDKAFSSRKIKTIIYGIDIDRYTFQDVDRTRDDLPQYIYNGVGFDDLAYLVNKDTYVNFAKMLLRFYRETKPQTEQDYVDLFNVWYPHKKLGEKQVLKAYGNPQWGAAALDAGHYLEIGLEHWQQNLEPFVRDFPETRFIFFMPPYSQVNWKRIEMRGRLDATLELEKTIMEKMLSYPHVEVHFFQDWYEVTTDLNLYSDTRHYGEPVSRKMADALKRGDFRVTRETLESRLLGLKNATLAFPEPLGKERPQTSESDNRDDTESAESIDSTDSTETEVEPF